MRTPQSAMCLDDGCPDDRCIHTDITPITLSFDDYDKVLEIPEYWREQCEGTLRDDEYDEYDENDDDAFLYVRFAGFFLFDEHRLNPVAQYSTYFKRDHPDDDLFLNRLGDAQVPWRSQLKYPKHADEPLIKDVVASLIWQETNHPLLWIKLRDDSLYSHLFKASASLVYFLYTQIGHERKLDKQMDKIFTEAEKWSKKGTPFVEACKLLIKLTADKDEFSFVTENNIADVLWYYDIDLPYKNFLRPLTVKVHRHPEDKDQLFEDITKVVKKVESSPTELKADEYTHLMMMLLREDFTQLAENLIYNAIGDNNPMFKQAQPPMDALLDDLYSLLLPLLVKARFVMRQELLNVAHPLNVLGKLHECKVCTEISETIQVADLRRMSLGSRFIGRSHLIWAFYKLGYALPLEMRDMIDIFDSDEDHPPYHIYMIALKLALWSGEKKMQLDHFIYAVLNSKDIDFDGEQWTECYQDFKDFQKALESMEAEVEPKSTVTVRPCMSLDIFSDSSNDSDDSQERTTNFEPSSSENSSTDTGDAEESII